MPYETLAEAFAAASMEQLIKAAKEKGYEAVKEEGVIKQRDKLLSAKVAAEDDAAEYKAKFGEADKRAKTDKERAEKAEADLRETRGLVENYDDIKMRLENFEKAAEERKVKTEEEYNKTLEAWKKVDEKIEDVLPPIDNIETKLKWMQDNEARLFGKDAPLLSTPQGPPEPEKPIPDSIIEEAETRGVAPETWNRIQKKQAEKQKQKLGGS